MKRSKFLPTIILLFVSSCEKSPYEEAQQIAVQNESIGSLHNDGLTYIAHSLKKKGNRMRVLRYPNSILSTSIDQKPGKTTFEEAILSSTLIAEAYEFVSQVSDFSNVKVNEDLNKLLTNGLDFLRTSISSGVPNYWDALVADNQLGGVISSKEQSIMQEFGEIFQEVHSLGVTDSRQEYHILKEKLQALKAKNKALDSEIFNGAIDVAINSADYWYDFSYRDQTARALYHTNSSTERLLKNRILSNQSVHVTNTPKPVEEAGYLVQADAIGYLVNWGQAVWEDSRKPGGVKPSGANDRIGKGLWGALSFSAGAALPLKPVSASTGNEEELIFVGHVTGDILPFPN